MYPPSPFSDARASFRSPVGPPASGPFDAPLYQVCINRDWLPYIAGSLKQLLLQSTWPEGTSDADLHDIEGRVFDLISAFGQINEGCQIKPPTLLCISGLFQDEGYGWQPSGSSPCASTWVSGSGWESCHDSGTNKAVLNITRVLDNATFIRHAKFCFDAPIGDSYTWTVNFFYLSALVFTQTFDEVTGGGDCFDADINQQVDAIQLVATEDGTGGTWIIRVQDWELCYSGDFPLAEFAGSTFSHVFDFALSDGGWTPRTTGEASYISGNYWTVGSMVDNVRCAIEHSVPSGTRITSMVAEFDWAFGSGSLSIAGHRIYTFLSGSYESVQEDTSPVDGGSVTLFCFDKPDLVGFVFYSCEGAACTPGHVRCRKITVNGLGTDPF